MTATAVNRLASSACEFHEYECGKMALCTMWTAEVEVDSSKLSGAIRHGLQLFGYDRLKPAQAEALQAIIQGQDTFVNVPTGYGKSLVYQLLPFCASFMLEKLGKTVEAVPFVLVVSPLLALMQDQAHKLRQIPGAKPLLLSEESAVEADKLVTSGWTHILASPEALLESPRWKKLLLSSEMMGSLVAVVIDEAHCIVKWGMGSVFRRWYGQVCQIRSFAATGTPVVALTATATKETCGVILKHLKMTQPHIIHLSPDRPNVRYSVMKASRELDNAFRWLLDDLREKRQTLPRVLVFCRSITTCTQLYKMFLTELREHSYDPPTSKPDIQKRLFAMFHSRVDDDDKEKIMKNIRDPAGTCRVVFCTIAFGMGVDISDVRTVIHYGPSSDVDDYLQEAGRTGRDGLPSNAILYCYPGCTLGHVSPAMKKYVTNDDVCRRSFLLQSFPGSHNTTQLNCHSCCDVCTLKCSCATPCSYWPVRAEDRTVGQEDESDEELPVPVRFPTAEQLKELQLRLHALREQHLNVSVPLYVGNDIASGFPMYVIDSVVSQVQYITSPEDLEEMCLVWNYAYEIMDIIENVCD